MLATIRRACFHLQSFTTRYVNCSFQAILLCTGFLCAAANADVLDPNAFASLGEVDPIYWTRGARFLDGGPRVFFAAGTVEFPGCSIV